MRRLAVLVPACCAVLFVACGGGRPPAGQDRPVAEVDSQQLWNDYRDNPAAADAKYAGKLVKVTGTVWEFQGEGGHYRVGFLLYTAGPAGSEPPPGVVCEFSAAGAAKAGALTIKKGSRLTVAGRCKGSVRRAGQFEGFRVELQNAEPAD